MALADLTFPLVPRDRVLGISFGALRSSRRGLGSDAAGSRPYRPGDDVDTIDWAASARVSSARGTDEFIVRERYAEESPRVVVVCDRRASLGLFPRELPWLHKPDVLGTLIEMIGASAAAARGLFGYLDFARTEDEDGVPYWRSPRAPSDFSRLEDRALRGRPLNAPARSLELAFEHLGDVRRSLPPGTFVFVLSDFLDPPPPETWLRVLEHRWDVVPVVVQDPVWEQSFPPVGSISVPIVDVATGRLETMRLTRREAARRRDENERRLTDLLGSFLELGLDPAVVSSGDEEHLLGAMLAWSDDRATVTGQVWRRGV